MNRMIVRGLCVWAVLALWDHTPAWGDPTSEVVDKLAPMACVDHGECEDVDVCTWDRCNASACEFLPSTYGDVNHDTGINVFDLFCVLNGFGGNFSEECNEEDCDITGDNTCLTCGPNGTINVFDLFAVLNAFGGGDPCCSGAPCPVMVQVPGGEFQMGDSWTEGGYDERPVHPVSLSPYYIDVHEVTNQQYCDYLNSAYSQGLIEVNGGVVYATGGSEPYCDTTTSSSYSRITWDGGTNTFGVTADKEDHPMVEVNWYGAAAHANWRSAQEGRDPSYNLTTWECDFGANGYRLPTEAEWEYAARGGEHSPYYRYPWGDSIDGSMANYWYSGDPYETGPYPWTTRVGYYDGGQIPAGSDMANGYGLYDMAGNVWEWCNDWYDSAYYSSSPYDNPRGPASGTYRVLRGGSWSDYGNALRCASRGRSYPDIRYHSDGFRLLLDSE